MQKKLFYSYFLFLSCVGFVPYFGSIDIIGTQWLYLSLTNFLFFIPLLINKPFIDKDSKLFNFLSFKFYAGFVIFSLLSLFYTNNISVSLVDFSRILIVFSSIILLFFYASNLKFSFKKLSIIISVVILGEILFSFYPFVEFLIFNSFDQLDINNISNNLKGVTGNKNVLAANIVFKLPFVYYLFVHSKNWIKFLLSFLLMLSFLILFLLSSRASVISLSILIFSFLLVSIYSKRKKDFIIFLSIVAASFTLSILPKDDSELLNRLASTSATETSVNHRIYLYQNSIDFFLNNPLSPVGIGNWKVESLPYWKNKLTGYTIPYHAHNDFLELLNEIGLIGSLLYFFVFIYFFYFLFKHILKKRDVIGVLMFASFFAYFVDAMLNFPLERAISQVNFVFAFSIISLIIKTKFSEQVS